ncbi:MAG: hypothetical protein MK108_01030 [Mariniblastus sp.]|nr:hypothetical protein [Mariniblastus sp.]
MKSPDMLAAFLFIVFCFVLSLICLVGCLFATCRFPVSAGRYWLGIGLTILLLLEFAPNLFQFMMIYFSPRSRLGWTGYPTLLSQFSFVGWICIWIGLVQAGRWMFQARSAYQPDQPRERGTSLLFLGLIGLIVWPLAPLVRYHAGRDLRSIDEKKLDEKQRGMLQVAQRLGWIGSLLLVGGGTAALIMLFVLFFEIR